MFENKINENEKNNNVSENKAGPTFGSPSNQQGYNPNASANAQSVGNFERDEDGYVIFPTTPIAPIENKSHSINTWLANNVKEFVTCKSIYDGKKISYDTFLMELSYDLFDLILKTNLLKTKSVVSKIKKQLVYILVSTKELPDLERDLVFNTTLRFIDFLKTVVYYPDTDKINEEVIAYLPILKETAIAFKTFLVKNR